MRTTRERPGLHLPASLVATNCSRPDLSMRRLDINTGDSGEDSEAAHFVNESEGSGDDSGSEPALGARVASRAGELQDDGRNSSERQHFRGLKRSEEAKNVTGAFIAVVLLAAVSKLVTQIVTAIILTLLSVMSVHWVYCRDHGTCHGINDEEEPVA